MNLLSLHDSFICSISIRLMIAYIAESNGVKMRRIAAQNAVAGIAELHLSQLPCPLKREDSFAKRWPTAAAAIDFHRPIADLHLQIPLLIEVEFADASHCPLRRTPANERNTLIALAWIAPRPHIGRDYLVIAPRKIPVHCHDQRQDFVGLGH